MTGLQREKMSAVDTAWLRMDRPGNLMMISGVLVFGRPVRFERVKRVIRDRFIRFQRFRQRPVQVLGAAYWESAPDFSIDDHVLAVALPGRAGTKELQALVSRLASRPLDPARPMWEFHVVENFDRGSAIDRAHPPLLCGRHRARARDDVDDRRRAERPAGHALRAAFRVAGDALPRMIRSRRCWSRFPA